MSDFTLAELRLAFGYHFARLVLESDDNITLTENDFLQRHFAREDMDDAGFMDASGAFTQRYSAALRHAAVALPAKLSIRERLDYIGLLLEAAMADDTFDFDEGSIVERAAGFLQIPSEALDAWFATQSSVGSVELPQPE